MVCTEGKLEMNFTPTLAHDPAPDLDPDRDPQPQQKIRIKIRIMSKSDIRAIAGFEAP